MISIRLATFCLESYQATFFVNFHNFLNFIQQKLIVRKGPKCHHHYGTFVKALLHFSCNGCYPLYWMDEQRQENVHNTLTNAKINK